MNWRRLHSNDKYKPSQIIQIHCSCYIVVLPLRAWADLSSQNIQRANPDAELFLRRRYNLAGHIRHRVQGCQLGWKAFDVQPIPEGHINPWTGLSDPRAHVRDRDLHGSAARDHGRHAGRDLG